MSTDGGARLRRELLAAYHAGQALSSSSEVYRDVSAAWPHYEANYRALFAAVPPTAATLDVGTGHGSLLAWLRTLGYVNLAGVDASEDEVMFANSHLGAEVVTAADATDFLESRRQTYDVLVMKAVLEHVPRSELLRALEALAAALRQGGMLIVEVPNMDWLLAGHERYMDLTHEIGFTRESLRTFLSLRFASVSVAGSHIADPTRSQRLLRPPLIRVARRLLYVLGEGANDTLFAHRSLIATASAPIADPARASGAARATSMAAS